MEKLGMLRRAGILSFYLTGRKNRHKEEASYERNNARFLLIALIIFGGMTGHVIYGAVFTKSYQVGAGGDDGYAWGATEQDITANFLKVGDENVYHAPYYMSAMRFVEVGIPRSAVIVSANLKIYAPERTLGQVYGVIQAEAADQVDDFTVRNIGAINKTAAVVDWDQKLAWEAGTWQVSPDMAGIVQEVVNRSGWYKDNNLAICYSTRMDSGKARTFSAYEAGAAKSAILEITYEFLTISGHVTTSDGTPLAGVMVDAGAGIESAVTDAMGFYSLNVPPGWSGTVTVEKEDWGFTFFSRSYANVQTDQTDQNYTGFQPIISGYVYDPRGAGFAGVAVSADNGGGSAVTDPNGYYEIVVTYDWTGTFSATLSGYHFADKSFTNIIADLADQDFNGFQPTISGSTGVAGATITVNGVESVISSPAYSVTVPYGWSGTVEVSLTGYHFPESPRSYTNVTADQTNQNFTPFQPTISGSTGLPGAMVTISGIRSIVSTPAYSVTVPYGWSGTIEVSLADYDFLESPKSYTNVITDQANQNFTPFQPTISGTVAKEDGTPIAGVVVAVNNGGGTDITDMSGYYEIIVPYNWSGIVYTEKLNWSFDPNNMIYSNVTTDQTGQDYTGTYAGLKGIGTQNDPHLIESIDDFDEFASNPAYWAAGVHTRLMTDIDLSGRTLSPIGNGSTRFAGVFDGKGHIIINAEINMSSSNYIGVFGCLDLGGLIRNLGLENVNINGNNTVGGLTGYNFGTITYCYSTGTIHGYSGVGGLVGHNSGRIIFSYSEAEISGETNLGGFIGYNYGNGEVSSCYSTGSVSSIDTSYFTCIGGFIGGSGGGSISSCYSTGFIGETGSRIGGFTGRYGGGFSSCFWDTEASGTTEATGYLYTPVEGIIGKTTAQMQDINTFLSEGWDFAEETENGTTNCWTIISGEYPTLNQSLIHPFEGSGTPQDPFLIYDANDLGAVNRDILASYRLMNDINLINIEWSLPVIDIFRGTFDGNGYKIINVLINQPGKNEMGLIGELEEGGQVYNFGLENVNIIGRHWVGGLVGENNGGFISSCHSAGSVDGGDYSIGGLVGLNRGSISSCYTEVMVSGTDQSVGGLVGENFNSGTINLCYSTGDINGVSGVGGLAGGNEGSIVSCNSSGEVNGERHIGGLLGINILDGTIHLCYSTNSVNGISNVGGLAGRNDGIVNSCYAHGDVNGTNQVGGLIGNNTGEVILSQSTGTVSGIGDQIGGFIGYNAGSPEPFNRIVSFCHSTGSVNGSDDVGGFTGYNINGTINSCYSIGEVVGNTSVGGFLGRNDGSVDICYSMGSVYGIAYIGGLVGTNLNEVNSCYSISSVNGTYNVGGLFGNHQGQVSSSFWDTETSGTTDGVGKKENYLPDPPGVLGRTTSEMQTQSTFTIEGWDFDSEDGDPADWMMLREGEDYPRLAWQEVYGGDIAGLYGVDMEDLLEVAGNWLEEGCPAGCEGADINGDGRVDLEDFAVLAGNWLRE